MQMSKTACAQDSLCASSSDGPGVAVLLRPVSLSRSMSPSDNWCCKLDAFPAFLLRALPLPMLFLQADERSITTDVGT